MRHVKMKLILVFLFTSSCLGLDPRFPPGFQFGAASSAYQIEGAWNVSDKTPSIWDTHTHQHPEFILDGSNGDVACDSYRLWREDVRLAQELGLDYYRFSISWPRLLPNGLANKISDDGARYYNNLIDALLEKGIQPAVTLYHWDMPQRLQNLGGWASPLSSDWFADYARVAFTLFGDRVKTWLTINEPNILCVGYTIPNIAPGISDMYYGEYLCTKHVLVAHGKAYRIYDEEFRSKYHGRVSIASHLIWVQADEKEHQELAEMVREHSLGRYTHPVFSKEGGWPPLVEEYIAAKSKAEGYPRSRLPAFTEEEKKLLQGSHDFFSLNYYTSRTVRPHKLGEDVNIWPYGLPEYGVVLEGRPDWFEHKMAPLFKHYPKGLRKLLSWIKQRFGDLEIVIMENGYCDDSEALEDPRRIQYMEDHLKQILLAIQEDGVKVTGYTAWTLLDNFEWDSGFLPRFGLHAVNYSDPNLTRTPRQSARYYASVIKHQSIDVDKPHLTDAANTTATIHGAAGDDQVPYDEDEDWTLIDLIGASYFTMIPGFTIAYLFYVNFY